MFMNYAALTSGIYLVALSFLIKGDNVRSTLIMSVIPGIIGVGLMITGSRGLGLI